MSNKLIQLFKQHRNLGSYFEGESIVLSCGWDHVVLTRVWKSPLSDQRGLSLRICSFPVSKPKASSSPWHKLNIHRWRTFRKPEVSASCSYLFCNKCNKGVLSTGSGSYWRVFLGVLSQLEPLSLRLHCSWFHRISSFMSVLQKPRTSRELLRFSPGEQATGFSSLSFIYPRHNSQEHLMLCRVQWAKSTLLNLATNKNIKI